MADKAFQIGDSLTPLTQPPTSFLNSGESFNDIKEGLLLDKAIKTYSSGGIHNPSGELPSSYLHKDSGKGEILKLDFQPNLLDNYDAVTYHFKLFMTSTEVSRSGAFLNPANQVIIAESGVSDLTIDKVEMNGIAVPSVEAGTGTQTTIRFEIVEPSGAGLLDKMFYESVLLGIGNWFVMPCYLELSFKARNPITSNVDNDGQPGKIGALSWVWAIKLSNARANVTTVGTRYEFEAIVYNELAQSNAYFSLQHSASFSMTTFGEAMVALEKKLNNDQFIKLSNNYSQADTYRIVVDPELAKTEVIFSDDNENSYRSGSFEILKDKTAQFAPGVSIDKIIDALLANTKRYQVQVTGAQNEAAGSNPKTINQTIDKMKKFWRITTETRPIVFDYKRQDNAVEIVIFVFEYDLGVNPASPTTTGGTPGTAEASKEQLNEYITKRILKKKYNYIFTGLNDQVITFDLNMNFSFAAALTRFGGVYYDSAGSDKGPVMQKNAEEERKVTEQVTNVISKQNNASAEKNPAEIQKLTEETIVAVNNSQLDSAKKLELITLMRTSKPIDRLALVEQSRSFRAGLSGAVQANNPGDVGTGIESASEEERINRLHNELKQRSTAIASPPNSNLKFVSDLDINNPEVKQAYADFIAVSKSKLRPIPFRETAQESSVGNGKEGNSDSGKVKTASLFSTALYSTIDASLLQIKLTIKGDPYWLFPQPVSGEQDHKFLMEMSETDAMTKIKSSHMEPNSRSVNLFGTDNFIIIRFRTPRIYNEVTNPSNPDPHTEVQAFSGVYRVLTLVSKFEMGKFTQELTCQLDPVIDTKDLIDRIEKDAQQLDTAGQPKDLLAKPLQPTAVKTQRLQGPTDQVKGVANTIRTTGGAIMDAGKSSIGAATDAVKSNIPPPPSFDLVGRSLRYVPNIPRQE